MKSSSKSGLVLVIGTIIGAILAFLFGTDEEGQTKKTVKDTVKKTKASIKNADKKKILDTVEKARQEVEAKLAILKKSLDSIDKEKYQKAVNEVITELKKTGKTTGQQLSEIKDFLMADYSKISKKESPKKAK